MSCVGIFWFVPANIFAMSAIVTDMTPLNEVSVYDGRAVHARRHQEFWSNLACLGAKGLRSQGLPRSIAGAAFDTYPRGRIEFYVSRERFVIYADSRIHEWAYMQYVIAFFGLSYGNYTIEADQEYTSDQPLGPPKPWY
jgi:hypothetical protein